MDQPSGPRPAAGPGYAAVVLAGGAGRRLGGADKPALRVGGRTLLDRVLHACRDAVTTVVVGPRRPTARPVAWTREDPPGGGPVAALAAGLRRTHADTVVVLSADLPFLEAATVRALVGALDADDGAAGDTADSGDDADAGGGGCDGALLVDADGRDQPLAAAYRAEPLRRELALQAAEHGGVAGLPMRLLTPGLRLSRLPSGAVFDCDTWEDLAAARSRIRDHGVVLDEWLAAVKEELDIDTEVDTRVLLDLARDAAHGVARPAAPLTTFLVGYAAARAGGDPAAVAEAARKISALAERWAAEAEEGGEGSAPGRVDG